MNDEYMVDLEEELCRILDQEIWAELEAVKGLTKAEYDQQIIEKIVEANLSKDMSDE